MICERLGKLSDVHSSNAPGLAPAYSFLPASCLAPCDHDQPKCVITFAGIRMKGWIVRAIRPFVSGR